ADTAAAHEHDGVLLQVVALTGDVGRDLDAARKAHASDLAQRRVRLLRGVGVNPGAHAAALGRALEGRGLGLGGLAAAALADQLLDGGQRATSRCFRSGFVRRTGRAGAGGPAHRTPQGYGRSGAPANPAQAVTSRLRKSATEWALTVAGPLARAVAV